MMLKQVMRPLVAMALLMAAACSPPNDLAVCHADCDAAKKCGITNDVQTQNCHNDCQNHAGDHTQSDTNLAMNCANVGEIRQREIDCLSNTDVCNVLAVATCQTLAITNYCLKK